MSLGYTGTSKWHVSECNAVTMVVMESSVRSKSSDELMIGKISAITVIHNSHYAATACQALKPRPLHIQVSPGIVRVQLARIQLK